MCTIIWQILPENVIDKPFCDLTKIIVVFSFSALSAVRDLWLLQFVTKKNTNTVNKSNVLYSENGIVLKPRFCYNKHEEKPREKNLVPLCHNKTGCDTWQTLPFRFVHLAEVLLDTHGHLMLLAFWLTAILSNCCENLRNRLIKKNNRAQVDRIKMPCIKIDRYKKYCQDPWKFVCIEI